MNETMYWKNKWSETFDKLVKAEKRIKTMQDAMEFNDDIIKEWIDKSNYVWWYKSWLEYIEQNYVIFDDDLFERIENEK